MSVTSGFFPIRNGIQDRQYDTNPISGVFQGIYLNGISSVIGNAFCCRKIDDYTISIDTGFGYFDGFYVKNDDIIIYEVPEDAYGFTPITGIFIEKPAQMDYPSDTYIDLGNLRVYAQYGEIINGTCYIVIRKDLYNRIFEIKAVNVENYDLKSDIIIAICEKNNKILTVKNLVGYEDNDIIGPPILPGINQSIYLIDLINSFKDSYNVFESLWTSTNELKYENWMSNNRYVLDTPDQYSRLTNELSTKENKSIILSGIIRSGDTSIILNSDKAFNNVCVEIITDPINLYFTKVIVDDSKVTLYFNKITRDYKVTIYITEVVE